MSEPFRSCSVAQCIHGAWPLKSFFKHLSPVERAEVFNDSQPKRQVHLLSNMESRREYDVSKGLSKFHGEHGGSVGGSNGPVGGGQGGSVGGSNGPVGD
jgi:hypothetical protein